MTEPNPGPRPDRCRVVGVLDDGAASLSAAAKDAVRRADVVIGAARTLTLLDSLIAPDAERRDLTGAIVCVPDWVRAAQAAGRRVVVLATGDPLCHGIAAFLASRLCIEAVEILPNVSTIQLACARLGVAWQDLKIVSIHGADAGEWHDGAPPTHGLYALRRALQAHDRVAVLTSPANTPARVARMLLAEGLAEDFQLGVAERLCQRGERVLAPLAAADAAAATCAEPNVLLLWRVTPRPRPALFGLDDTAYARRLPENGLITKQEVRAVSLARLALRRDSVVWDIGAGSGSVGIEAARLCDDGHVWAIEKNAGDVLVAAANRRAAGVFNHTLVHGRAPDGLAAWPDPDAVFVGGSGGELGEIVRLALRRLKPGGRLVLNLVTIENLATATDALKGCGARWDIVQLQASRSRPVLDLHRLVPENPVWIVCAEANHG